MNFDVIFDNGGGITLQTEDDFRHYYDDPKQAATDVRVLLDGNNTSDWEGNESELFQKQEYSLEIERNGGYRWHNQTDVRKTIERGTLSQNDDGWGWRNSEGFYTALGVKVND